MKMTVAIITNWSTYQLKKTCNIMISSFRFQVNITHTYCFYIYTKFAVVAPIFMVYHWSDDMMMLHNIRIIFQCFPASFSKCEPESWTCNHWTHLSDTRAVISYCDRDTQTIKHINSPQIAGERTRSQSMRNKILKQTFNTVAKNF